MAISKAQIRASSKYESKVYDKILVRLPKGERERIQEFASSTGESLNGFIIRLLREAMKKEET